MDLELKNKYSISDIFLVTSCIFLPLQIYSLSIASSRFDLTIFFVIFFIICQIKYIKLDPKKICFFTLFSLLVFLNNIYLNISPLSRFFSAFLWLSFLLIIILFGDKFRINYKYAFYSIIIPLLLVALCTIFSYIALGISRPKVTFDEPSFAGLNFYSASLGLIAICFYHHSKTTLVLFLSLIFFIAGVITKSMHIFSFFISLFILILTYKNININCKIFISLLIIITLILLVINNDHYLNRINILDPNDLSLLAWLRGLDQAIYSFNNYSILGSGLGSTGEFEFNSDVSNRLKKLNFETLNLTDAYSMFFRLIIEVGILITTLLFFKIYFHFRIILLNIMKINYYGIFCLFFSITLILGILIKEPAYSRSYVFIGFLLYFSSFLRGTKLIEK
jgi:hypothetical protein